VADLPRDQASDPGHHRAGIRPHRDHEGNRRSDTAEEAAMSQPLRFSGVMPANVLPSTSDLALDEPAYRRHLRWLADTRGVTGIVAHGPASAVSSLTRQERSRFLAISLDAVAGARPAL